MLMQAFFRTLSKNVKHCHHCHDSWRWVIKHPRLKPNSHPLPCPINTTWKMKTYLETIMPFTWRNLNRSCAFSRSLNFSLAVKVSYGTKRGWLPPPGVRWEKNTTVFLCTLGECSCHAPWLTSPIWRYEWAHLCSPAPASSSWPRYCDSSQPPPPPFPVPQPERCKLEAKQGKPRPVFQVLEEHHQALLACCWRSTIVNYSVWHPSLALYHPIHWKQFWILPLPCNSDYPGSWVHPGEARISSQSRTSPAPHLSYCYNSRQRQGAEQEESGQSQESMETFT